MRVLYQRCAGIDEHKDQVTVAVRLPGPGPGGRDIQVRGWRRSIGPHVSGGVTVPYGCAVDGVAVVDYCVAPCPTEEVAHPELPLFRRSGRPVDAPSCERCGLSSVAAVSRWLLLLLSPLLSAVAEPSHPWGSYVLCHKVKVPGPVLVQPLPCRACCPPQPTRRGRQGRRTVVARACRTVVSVSRAVRPASDVVM
jgi:hypothetical protein